MPVNKSETPIRYKNKLDAIAKAVTVGIEDFNRKELDKWQNWTPLQLWIYLSSMGFGLICGSLITFLWVYILSNYK